MVPLCVDLDGTLIRTDLLVESFLKLATEAPLAIPRGVWTLIREGRAPFKRYLAERISLDPAHLPYRGEVVEWIKEERHSGRKVLLASASDEIFLEGISRHLGIFDEVVGSNGTRNLKGSKKRELLVERFGEGGFEYVGDHPADLRVWRSAQSAVVVTRSEAFLSRVKGQTRVTKVFMEKKLGLKTIFRAVRVHQWVKNLLLFVPLLMAHQWNSLPKLIAASTGFIAFSLCASSVYLINDLMDIEADRQHATKRNRPIASGAISIPTALIMALLFLAGGGVLGIGLGAGFLQVLGLYFFVTLLYSTILKRLVLVDIIVLASLYSIRILAGGAAVQVPVSQWLVAFSMFLFFSLACVKRYSEILALRRDEKKEAKGRGYISHDLEQISQFGAASGSISILVLALYINSREVTALYGKPEILWLVCPLLYYWISRVWLLAGRGKMHEDPIVFALGDITSYVVGLLSVAVILFSL